MSLHAMRALGLHEVWWLVSPGNPLKAGVTDMAPLATRVSSARAQARRAPIRVSAIEARLGTRYTIDTVRKLVARYPDRRFVWLMGVDNLDSFHRWRDWRGLARKVPIAVVARPGYEGRAQAVRAMGWLRRFVRTPGLAKQWTQWSPPAILILRLPLDPASATALRADDPEWAKSKPLRPPRDTVTHKLIT